MVRRLAVLAALALVGLAGCGGGSEGVPADAIAVVDGETVSRADYDALLARTRKSYENEKRDFPKAGTREFQQLKTQFVQYLVERAELEQAAHDLDVEVTEEQVDKRLEQIRKQYFGGDKKKYEQQLRASGITDAQVRKDIRGQLLSEKVFAKVTGDVKVTDAEIKDYYEKNKAQYSQPATREVRHIFVKTKAKADSIYEQLEAGADFAKLAKKHSEDFGSRDKGGKVTVSQGQAVPEFDKAAFALKVKERSKPVKTQYGFHIIEALGPVRPSQAAPLADVEDAIRQQLRQSKRNEAMTKWLDDLKHEYEDKVEYQTGFEPPATTAATTSTATATTAP